jgi:pilus assembly protein Flp/PilA
LLICFELEGPGAVRQRTILKRFLADQSGATAIEYALICGIMFLAILAISATGGALQVVYDRVSSLIPSLGG